MDSVDVQEFLLSATANTDSILMETDKIFDKTADSTSTSSMSLYYSINDDTMSNRLVEDLQQMERTLTDLAEEDESHKSTEMSSVIRVNNNSNSDLLLTTKEDESFLPLKLFPGIPLGSQCSTPKLEVPVQHKINIPDIKITAAIPDLVLPLTTILKKIEKKTVTIVEATIEDKENVKEDLLPELPAKAKQVTIGNNMRKSLKPVGAKAPLAAAPPALKKVITSRKSMIPNAPTTSTATAISNGTLSKPATTSTKSTLMASRKSSRMSVVPTTFKSSRFTIGGARSGRINSPSAINKSPRSKKMGTVTKTNTGRMTITAASVATTDEQKQQKVDVKSRLSRIPPPHPQSTTGNNNTGGAATSTTTTATTTSVSSHPRPVFSCKICKKSFHLKSTLTMHQKIHDAASGTGAALHFKCTYCDKDFEKEIGLRNHVERYCTKVPVAEKRKLNGSRNRTRTTSAELKDRSKRDKSSSNSTSSSRMETTGNSTSSQPEGVSSSTTTTTSSSVLFGGPTTGAIKKDNSQPAHPPASGLSPRKPIKSIIQPHSGIKFSANKPIKCFQCRITFSKYVDFHTHVELVHPQPVGSPVGKEGPLIEAEVGVEKKE